MENSILNLQANNATESPRQGQSLTPQASVNAATFKPEAPLSGSPDLSLEIRSGTAYLGGNPLSLTKAEFNILSQLMAQADEPVSRHDILRIAFPDSPSQLRTVDVHVVALRRKLGRLGERIQTVRGVGYRYRSGN